MQENRILIIDDDPDVLTSLRILLKRNNFEVKTETNPESIPYLMSDFKPNLIFLDMNFKRDVNSGNEGIFWLQKINTISINIPVIMITGYGDIDLAIKSIRNGASDFILKPWSNEKLLNSINSIIKKKEYLKTNIESSIIGESESISELKRKIGKVASTDANILITGENGTGKELVAKDIQRLSERSKKPFITIDLGLIKNELFESELFGHMKGSFTDAKEDRIGKLESADGGTVFLDEIGNLPIDLQPKLLRVLESRTIQKVGSNLNKPIDIRLISATNENIDELIVKNRFRQDLFYRINTIEINVPPLRKRGKDVILIAKHYLKLFAEKNNRQNLVLTNDAINFMMTYDWPGNVRELKHTIERAVILNDSNTIDTDSLSIKTHDKNENKAKDLETLERSAIIDSLTKYSGNVSKAAKELGLTRASLYRRMEKYKL